MKITPSGSETSLAGSIGEQLLLPFLAKSDLVHTNRLRSRLGLPPISPPSSLDYSPSPSPENEECQEGPDEDYEEQA